MGRNAWNVGAVDELGAHEVVAPIDPECSAPQAFEEIELARQLGPAENSILLRKGDLEELSRRIAAGFKALVAPDAGELAVDGAVAAQVGVRC